MVVDSVKVATADPDVAYEVLNEVYAPQGRMSFSNGTLSTNFEMDALELGALHAARIRHTLVTKCLTPPFERVLGGSTLLGGKMRWVDQGTEFRFAAGSVGRFPTTAPWQAEVSGMDCAVLRVSLDAVERVAEERTGISSATLRFDGMPALNESAGARWRSLTAYVYHLLGTPTTAPDNPIVLGCLVDLVAATALSVFPNTTMSMSHTRGPGDVAPAALRRAVAHIEARAQDPLTLSDIADAAGTTGRAIQAAFRRHYDTTPMAYLRRVRLERAHRDLQAADPTQGATVGAIAAKWGFGKAARFTEFYREAFGVAPSRTLRT